MAGIWIGVIVISVVVAGVTYWITNKAYSRKWEE